VFFSRARAHFVSLTHHRNAARARALDQRPSTALLNPLPFEAHLFDRKKTDREKKEREMKPLFFADLRKISNCVLPRRNKKKKPQRFNS
jgi:hypothetical protein